MREEDEKHELNKKAGLRAGKNFLFIILGGLIIHFIIMLIDYSLVSRTIHLDFEQNFWGSVFSVSMLPMMGIYILFLFITYSIWIRWKKAILLAQIEKSKKREVELVFESMQRLTGILAEKLSTHNVGILKWIASRKAMGKPVSNKIEEPAFMISKTLSALTEVSFVSPYTDTRPQDIKEIERVLYESLEKNQNLSVKAF